MDMEGCAGVTVFDVAAVLVAAAVMLGVTVNATAPYSVLDSAAVNVGVTVSEAAAWIVLAALGDSVGVTDSDDVA